LLATFETALRWRGARRGELGLADVFGASLLSAAAASKPQRQLLLRAHRAAPPDPRGFEETNLLPAPSIVCP